MNRGIQSLQATPKTLGPGHAIAFASQMPAYVAEHMDGLRQCGVFSGWLRRFMIVTNANSWFDYGLHLIADTYYEAPVAAHVTPASRSLKIILNNFSLGFLFSGQPIAEYNTGYWESYGARLKKKRYNANGSARQTVVQCLWTSDKMVLIVPILGHLLSGNFSTGGISEDDRIDGL